MNRKTPGLIATLIACLALAPAGAFEALDDSQLDAITAGSASTQDEGENLLARIPLRHHDNNHKVDGEILVLPAQNTSTLTGNLQPA